MTYDRISPDEREDDHYRNSEDGCHGNVGRCCAARMRGIGDHDHGRKEKTDHGAGSQTAGILGEVRRLSFAGAAENKKCPGGGNHTGHKAKYIDLILAHFFGRNNRENENF